MKLLPDPKRIAIATGIPFGFVMGGFMFFLTGKPMMGLEALVVGGIGFGGAMAGFLKAMTAKQKASAPPEELRGRTIVCEGPANHFLRGEGRGGWLYLTDSSLYFKPHAMNVQKDSVEIPIEMIQGAKISRTLGLIPNGLVVSTRDGAKQRFVVHRNGEWVRLISRS